VAEPVGPIQVSERIPTLDIVRGFALLGILIMNMPGFASSFYAEADGSHLWADSLNQRAEQIRDMLFSGKFNSMFSPLFGLGFTIQLGRMVARDPVHGTTLYVRRLLALLAFALVHCLVLWTGDVLHIYVVLGFVLLALRKVSNRTVVALMFYGWGFGLWGQVGPALQLLMAVSIFFVIQVPLSILWLRRFEYGPLEYIWRLLTYGHRPARAVAVATL
jgi:uncharacterized protein